MKVLSTLVGLVLLLGLSACGTSAPQADPTPKKTALQKAYTFCKSEAQTNATTESMDSITLSDGGTGMTDSDDTEATGLACMLVAMKAPTTLISNMDSTTAMMGRQTETHSGYTYQWSYYPDTGMNVTIAKN